MSSRFLGFAQSLLALPTAPFHEEAVRNAILIALSRFPHVSAKVDAFGNILARYQNGEAAPACAFVAHMDHPAYVGSEFRGGVPKSYLEKNFPVRSFGAFSMWDLPAFELREGCIFSRACDDLIGCAAILATLEELEAAAVSSTFHAVFTCAEEVGLLGATYLARSGALPLDVPVLSLETSSERPPAQMHHGVIVRVGDKTSVFAGSLVSSLTSLARLHEIPHQRCLMSGGTCEASAFQVFGYEAAGLCVALGNYHNCAPDGRIDSEFVSLSDCEALVRLCVEAARSGLDRSCAAQLRTRLESDLDGEMAHIHLGG